MNCVVAVILWTQTKVQCNYQKGTYGLWLKVAESNVLSMSHSCPSDCWYWFNTPPQSQESPSAFAKCLALTLGSTLVNVSASMSFVGHYMSLILFCLMTHRMKWKHMLMCFVLMWYWWSFVNTIADWLLEWSVASPWRSPYSSLIRVRSQRASFTVWVAATYSASIVDRDIISCYHDTAPPSIMKA